LLEVLYLRAVWGGLSGQPAPELLGWGWSIAVQALDCMNGVGGLAIEGRGMGRPL